MNDDIQDDWLDRHIPPKYDTATGAVVGVGIVAAMLACSWALAKLFDWLW